MRRWRDSAAETEDDKREERAKGKVTQIHSNHDINSFVLTFSLQVR
jgi:hypothetical protein